LADSRGESPPAASVAVPFDDGLINHAIHAIPMLRELQIPVAFFVPSAFVGSTRDLWVSALREIVRKWADRTIPEEPGRWPSFWWTPKRDGMLSSTLSITTCSAR
jgi:peptidoglycan/xylan/chitin deacetylase (PgdA/CDA1 family)